MKPLSTQYVRIDGSELLVNASSAAEAKLALKELRLRKREYALQKRSVTARHREIRARYTSDVRHRGSMIRGGGGFGRFVRGMQTISRDGKRSQLASDLAPLEREKQHIEAILRAIDSAILQLQAALLQEASA